MHYSARTIIAATLTVILTALACFEHALHDLSHKHTSFFSEKSEVFCAFHFCSHPHHSARGESSSEHESPPEHDSDNCSICRFLALPQYCAAPLEFCLAETFVFERTELAPPSFPNRSIHQTLIRGPPLA